MQVKRIAPAANTDDPRDTYEKIREAYIAAGRPCKGITGRDYYEDDRPNYSAIQSGQFTFQP